MLKFFFVWGFYGPLLLLGIILLTLIYRRTPYIYLLAPVLFFVGNVLLNALLKHLIRELRPCVGESLCETEPSADLPLWNWMQFYGMPSGHTQLVVAMAVLVQALYPKNTWVHAFLLTQVFLTAGERYLTYMHTMKQILVGALLGIATGTFYINFRSK